MFNAQAPVVLNEAKIPFYPLVSIVIPVYNGANYMREAIDSALKQTYKNIEIIVINDGSKDNDQTDAIAKSYGNKIRYFAKENGGCGSALNFGIAKMHGTYFSWLSHDDKYFPDKIAHQINILSTLQNQDTIIYGGYELINIKSKKTNTVQLDTTYPLEKLNTALFPLLRGLIHGCSLLIPTKYFTQVGVFDETLPSTQDYALWFDILRVAPVHFDNKILIQSRQHPEQGSNTINNLVEENNTLWSCFLHKLTHEEMTIIDDSPFLFLKRTAAFLANTPFTKAQNLALSMAADLIKNIKISVIIPFYNRIHLTIEAIQSVLAQTHQCFELLLINDGSTDDIAPLLNFIKLDDRIIYLTQKNSGASHARNTGIQHATGAYIAFLDSDDLFYPNKLAVQLDFMKTNGVALSHTSYDRLDLNANKITFMHSGKLNGGVFPQIITHCPIALPTVMGQALVFKNNPFMEHLSIAEDVCLWIVLTSTYTLGGIDLALTKVRVGNCTTANDTKKQIMGLINVAWFTLSQPKFAQYKDNIHDVLKNALITLCELNDPIVAHQLSNLLACVNLKQRSKIIAYYRFIHRTKQCGIKISQLLRHVSTKIIRGLKKYANLTTTHG